MALMPASTPHRAYWKKLLVWGVLLEVLSGLITAAGVNQAADSFDQSSSSDSGGLIALAFLVGGIGAVLLIPGMIGWGIDAAGLAVRMAPAPVRLPPVALPLAAPLPQAAPAPQAAAVPPTPPMFTRYCGSCGAGVGATDTHCWKCHRPM